MEKRGVLPNEGEPPIYKEAKDTKYQKEKESQVKSSGDDTLSKMTDEVAKKKEKKS